MPVSINNTTLTFNDATTQTTSGVTSIGTGTGISSTGGKTPTLTNTGVTSVAAGTGISVSASTGGVTITNTGPSTSGIRVQVFNTSGTFTIPAGVSAIKAVVYGGGGGGGGFNSTNPDNGNWNNGSAGNASSIASGNQSISAMTANGGGGSSGGSPGANGNVSGQLYFATTLTGPGVTFGLPGGNAFGGGGGQSGYGVQYYSGLTPGANLAITRGTGGAGGGGAVAGTAGQGGVIIIEF